MDEISFQFWFWILATGGGALLVHIEMPGIF